MFVKGLTVALLSMSLVCCNKAGIVAPKDALNQIPQSVKDQWANLR